MPIDYRLVTFSDVVAGSEDAFNAWYNGTHLPDFVACPGILSASRYECVDGQPKHLAVYDLDSPAAVATPEVRKVWGWGPVAPSLRNAHGRVYRRTIALDAADPGTGETDFILVTSSDVMPGAEGDFNAWYNDAHLPEILTCPGFRSATRYECTAGEPTYLAFYDIDSPAVMNTPEMQRVHGWGPVASRMRGFYARIYRRTCSLSA
jgi:hypothetical protein